MVQTNNLKVSAVTPLIAPADLKQVLPLSEKAAGFVAASREQIQNVLWNRDPRMMVVVGPCSIHDPKAALEYAERLAKLNEELKDQLLLVMRVYFEKPRTTIGWKGLINDPDLDESHQISKGLGIARRLMLDITDRGLPVATEMLDPITPQYMADTISWGAIGARTTESQTHRECRVVSPSRSGSRTAPMATCRLLSMPWARHATRTVFSALTVRVASLS